MTDKTIENFRPANCTRRKPFLPGLLSLIMSAVIASGCSDSSDKKPFEGTAKIISERQTHREKISRSRKDSTAPAENKPTPPRRELHSKRVTILGSDDKKILGYGEAYFTSKGKMIHIIIHDSEK